MTKTNFTSSGSQGGFWRWLKALALTLVVALLSFTADAQNVLVTATAGTTSGSYATVSAAFAAINAGTHQGAITLQVVANTTEPGAVTALTKSGPTSNYTSVLITPFGGNYTIGGTITANRAIIELNGADNVTIDGDDPTIAGTRNLTIGFSSTAATIASCIRVSSNSTTGTDGASNNTIKNCIITGNRASAGTTATYGINTSNYSTTSSSTGGYSSLNNRFENNLITRCYHGIWAVGTSATYPNTGLQIINNVLGDGTLAGNIGNRGIIMSYTSANEAGSAIVRGNEVVGVGDPGTTGYSASISGMEIGTVNFGAKIYNNYIHDVKQPTTGGYGAYGVLFSGATSCDSMRFYNNIITRITACNYTATALSSFTNYGVKMTAGSTFGDFSNNTIVLSTANPTGTLANPISYAVSCDVNGVRIVNFRNNIIVNTNASTNAIGMYVNNNAIFNASNYAGGQIWDKNCYWVPSGAVGFSAASTPQTTFSAWKTAVGKDGTSYNINPSFVSASDLHIDGSVSSLLESGGMATSFNTDFDGQARPGPAGSVNGGALSFDIGADEFDGVPIIPVSITSASATGVSCTAIAHTITATVVAGTNPITSVVLSYNLNGVAQTPITMTNTSGNIWEATIAAASPSNATIAWTVTATDAVSAPTASGSYQDDALYGVGMATSATPATVCVGTTSSVSASLYNPLAAPTTYTVQAVTNPTTDEDLGNVTITNAATSAVLLNNTTTYNSLAGTLGTATGTAGSYANYLTLATVPVSVGTTYNFSLSSLQGATAYGNSMAIYIDYNRDGDFADAGENVYVATVTTLGAHTETGSFTIPATANNGLTRMRVIVNEGLVTSPTMSISYGEREEYMLNITSSNNGGGGGIPSLTYSWSDGASVVGTTLTVAPTVNASTTYTLTATTAGGCTITGNVSVTANPLPVLSATTTDVLCNGGSTGSITASASGATAPYAFTLNGANGNSTGLYPSLAAGTYSVKVTDANGCSTTSSYTVNQPTALVASGSTVSATCNGVADGSVSFSATGGITPYTYTLNGTAATSPVTGLAAGSYVVVATDSNSCTATTTLTVAQPAVLAATATPASATTCPSTTTSVIVAATGGTAPYTGEGSFTQGISTQSYTVTDANGCTTSASATVGLASYTVTASAGANGSISDAGANTVNCEDNKSFTITANACYHIEDVLVNGVSVGAVSSYTFTNVTATNTIAASFAIDTYTITATAAAGGTITASSTQNCGSSVTYTVTPNPGYQIDSIIVNGVTTSYPAATLTASQAFNNISANNTIDAYFSIAPCTNPAVVTAPATASVCSGLNYTLSGSITGGTTSGTWSTSGTGSFDDSAFGIGTIYTPSAADIAAGTVTLTLTSADPDGGDPCSIESASTVLTINTTPTVAISGNSSYCVGGSTSLTASGADSYVWSTTATTAAITATAGTYSVVGTAANGCTSSASITVTENALPTAPVVSASGATTFCTGGSVTLTSDYVGGNTWSNAATTDAITVSTTGSYSVTYTDANGCSATSAATAVTVNASSVAITGATTYCIGGSSTLTATATPAAVSYAWSFNSTATDTTNTTSANAAGVYSVVTTDANGCTATSNVTVSEAPAFTVSVTGNCSTWVAGNTNVLTATPSIAGTFTYSWNGGLGTAATANATLPGTYTATVTDQYGCTATGSLTFAGSALSGTYSIGAGCGSFPTVASAITHLNTYGVSGNVTINVPAGYTETAPTGGYQLKMCALAANLQSGPAQTITIQKSGAGANPVLTAPVGASTSIDGIFVITGADNVRIDGINLTESAGNTTAATRMEWGYAVLKCDGNNGANDVTITNCNIALAAAFTAGNGIYVANHDNLSTTGFTNSTYTTTAQAARNKVSITNNTLNNCYTGIRLGANPNVVSTTGECLNDTLNNISNNTITNFGGAATSAYGIYYGNNRQITIRSNTISSSTTATSTTSAGIYALSGTWATICGNTIQNIVSSSTFYGIYHALSGGDATNPNIVRVDSNIIQTCTPTAGSFYGIYGSSTGGTSAQVSTSYNEFRNHTWASTSTATMYGMYQFFSGTNMTNNCNYNLVYNNTLQNTNTFYGIYGYVTSGTYNCRYNNIRNNILSPSSGTAYIMYASSSNETHIDYNNITNNRRNVLATATSVGTTYGFYALAGSTLAGTINNNVIDTLYNKGVPGTVTSLVYGLYYSGTSAAGSTINNNVVRNITTQGTSTGNQTIYASYFAPSGTGNIIKGNRIARIGTTTSTTGISTDAQFGGSMNSFVVGAQLAGSTTAGVTKFLDGNTFNTLIAGGSNGIARGIWVTTGQDWYIYNNAISRVNSPFSSPTTAPTASSSTTVTTGTAVHGIDIANATAGNNYYVYNNTVYLTGAGGGANFASSGIHANVTPNVTLVNNLVINNITSGGSQASVAYRRSGAALTTYQTASDYNLFYAGTPGATKLIYGEGVGATTNAKQTLADFQAFVGPTRDASSRTETTTPFVDAANDSLLHIAATTATFVEGGGKPYPATALTTDIDGQTRNLTAPDIGADEGNFVSLLPSIASATASPAIGQCTAADHTVTVVASASVTGVTLNYSYNGTAQTPLVMSNGGSGSTWTAVIPAATSPVNATVTWSVSATDGTYTVGATGVSYQDAYLTGVTVGAIASPTEVCLGSSTNLIAGSANSPSASLGNGTSTSSASGYPSAGGNYWYQDWQQFVYTAAELSAAGLVQGNISGLKFNIGAAANPAAVSGYSISLGTAASGTVTAFKTTGLTTVYGPTTFTTSAGLVNINFNTPYYWDGVSNIIVDVRGTGAYASGNATVKYTATASNTVAFAYTSSNNASFWTSNPTPTLSVNRPNIIFNGVVAPTGFTTVWSDGTSNVGTGNPLVYTPATAGTVNYSATLTDANGCVIYTAPVAVKAAEIPPVPTATASTQCGTGIPAIKVSGAIAETGYNWYLAASGGSPVQSGTTDSLTSYSISTTTTFYVSTQSIVSPYCESARTEVIATVTTPDAVAITGSANNVCPGTVVTLTANQTGTSNTYVYTWNGVGLNATSGSSVTATIAGAGSNTYNVTAVDSALGCTTTATITVTGIVPPAITSVTASPATICANETSSLTALTNQNVPGTAVFGTGTTTSTLYGPYYGFYGGNKRQYLIKASELVALGFAPGNITSVAFDYTAFAGPYTFNGFSIGMKTTAATVLTSTYETGLTTVLPSNNLTITAASGTISHTFATPFYWDGTSNLVMEFCWNNNDGGGTSTNTLSIAYTTMTGVHTIYSNLDNTATVCATATGTTTTIRPNFRLGGTVAGFGAGSLGWAWNDASGSLGTGNTLTVNPSTTTVYTAVATDATTGCTSSQNVTVNVNPLPAAPTATNSVQCGAGIPTASVTSASGLSTPQFNWYSASTGGTLLQGPPSATGPLATYYSNNFATSANGTITGNASLTGGRVQLTPNATSNLGGLQIAASGVNADKYSVDFKLTTSGGGGADGMSYSFGDDVSATSTTVNAEIGSGTKLSVGFDVYGGTPGAAGIRLIYGGTISNPGETVGTNGILAYSNDVTWVGGTDVPVNISINSVGKVTVTVNGTAIFTNVALPAAYLSANKASWQHVFKGRTGGLSMVHAIDDVTLQQSEATAGYTTYQSSISNSTTFYVSEQNATTGCQSARTPVEVTVNQPDSVAVTATVASASNCLGTSVTLSAANLGTTNTYDYTWNGGTSSGISTPLTGSSVTFTPTAAGTFTYTLTANDATAGCQRVVTTNVTINANPSIDSISASPATICSGDSVTLRAYTLSAGSQVLPTGYCTGSPSTTTFADEQIFSVSFGSMTNAQTESCTTNYTNYTATIPAVTAVAGQSYPFTVVTNECDGATYFSNGLSIYIDYNRDGDWDDAGEQAYTTTATTQSPNTRSGSIVIPATASPGLTRMRVVVQESVASPTVCPTFSYGEIEDYAINIIGLGDGGSTTSWSWDPGAVSGSIVTVAPTSTVATTQTYTVVATNAAGCTSQNSVNVNINPLPAAPTAVTGTICGFNTANVAVTSNTGATTPVMNWYLEATGNSSQISGQTGLSLNAYYLSSTDTFYVSESDNTTGCKSPRTMVIQDVTQPDAITASASADSICLPGATIDLNVTQTGSTNTYTYNWTAVPPVGSGLSGVQLGPVQTLFSNDFSISTLPSNVTVVGSANITGGVLQVTPNALSQTGGVKITAGGNAADTIAVDFDLIVPQNGADGVSYSYSDDGNSAVEATMNAENGTGSKLKLGFVSYTNGSSTNGIYLMYNCTTNEQTPTTTGVLAYSSNVSWRGSASPVHVAYTVGASGLFNLSLNGTPVFTDVQLPASYVSANKSNWYHVFKGRTGGVSEEHSIDNMVVKVAQIQSLPTPGQSLTITPTLPGTYTYQVTGTDGGCNSISTVSVVVNPAAPSINAGSDLTICEGGNVTLNSSSAGLIPALRFTEVLWQVNAGTGNTGAGIPAWASTWYTANGGTTMDMIEITNLGSSQATSAGVTIEMWNATSATTGLPAYTYTIPSNAPLMNSGGLLYFSHSGSAVVADITNNFYARGGTSIDNGSGTQAGMIMRKNGVIIDAVAVSGYTFPSTSGVTSADWSGTLASNSGLSGTILTAADNNTNSSWSNTSAALTASVGTLNSGLVANLPSLGTVSWSSIPSGFTGTEATSTFGPITVPTTFVVMFDNGSCQSYDTVVVTPSSTPAIPVISSNVDTICNSGVALYTASNLTQGATLQWQSYDFTTSAWVDIAGATSATYATPTFAPVLGDTTMYYRLKTTCTNAVYSNEDTLEIVRPLIKTTVGDTVCGGGTVDLVATGNGTMSWYETSASTTVLSEGNTYSPFVLSNTVYWVRASVGTCLDPAGKLPVIAVSNPAPAVTIAPATPAICEGSSTTLTASSIDTAYVYTWNGGLGSGATVTAAPTVTTTYSVVGTNPTTGCIGTANVTVSVNPKPTTPVITSSASVACPGASTTLTASSIGAGSQVAPSGYCTGSPSTTTFADEQIFGVTFGSMTNNQTENCSTNYTDYTSTITPINVITGSSYPFSVITDECDLATYYSNGLSIYIDYNRDGDWDDVGEQAYTTTATTISPNTRTGSIVIPSTASLGLTRMRVVVQESVASPTQCPTFSYGEMEDYLVNITGPIASYNWSTGGTTASISVTPVAGTTTYTVTATSAAGCTSDAGTYTIVTNPAPEPVLTATDTTLCAPNSINIYVVDNGTYAGVGYPAGTQVEWLGYGATGDPATTPINSSQGSTFQAKVTLPSGCYANSNVVTVTTRDIVVVPTISPAACGNSNGKVIAQIASAPAAPYNYVWTDGTNTIRNVTSANTTDSITGLAPGTYYLSVYDNQGGSLSCSATNLAYTVGGSTPPVLSATSTNITCNGSGDGSVDVSITSGGVAPFTYSWSNGATTSSQLALGAGTYTVTVSDVYGCSSEATVTVTEPAAITATETITQPCVGGTNGSISLNVSGGTGSVSVDWFDAAINQLASGNTLSSIGAGTYYALMTDANSCTNIGEYTVTEVGQTFTTTESVCDTYTWSQDSQTYTASGTYTSVSGCDTYVLNLTITPSTTNTTSETACDTYTWSVNGTTYTTSGTYSSVSGCHTEILNLTINTSTSNTTSETACDTYTWSANGTTYTTSGTYSSVSGCHTEILNLTINTSTSNTTSVSSCGSYTWSVDGNTYTQSGTYSSVSGCNTEYLNLTVTNVSISSLTPSTGSVGSTVVISGADFTGATGVSFNGTAATSYTVDNNGQITVTVPAGTTTGPVTVTVGLCSATSSGNFTVGTNATLNLKAYMQGYYAGSGLMVSVLENQGVSTNSNEVDTITVELYDGATGATLAASASGVILTDGTVSLSLPASVVGNDYYIAVKHRNTVATWSASAVTMGSTTSYDFTTAATQAYGDNMIEIETGVFAMYSGDMNQDEFVDPFDYGIYSDDNNNFAYGYYATDLNGDGFVDPFDYAIYNENNNNFVMSSHP